MNGPGLDNYFRQMIREEVRAAVGDDLQAIREEVAELRPGLPAELRGLLTLDQVAEYLGVHSQTARAWCNKKRIKLHKIGTATRVLGEDVHRVLTQEK